jgi:hypothetical protein
VFHRSPNTTRHWIIYLTRPKLRYYES